MKHTVTVDDTLWAGNEASLGAYVAQLARDEDRMRAGVVIGNYAQAQSAPEEEELPYLLERRGNVGVVSIKGPTSNRVGYWDEYDKRATYPAIREAMIAAAQHPEITSILLDIDSGGGAVSGVADTAALIRQVHKVKPVTAFTDGNMMSAAYWLGSSAGKVYASNVAGAGSIGVIATHMDLSKMFEQMGITPTVVRAGKFKALANEMEPLSDKGREQMQASLDAVYGVFVQHVADMRGVDYSKADSTMAQGKEFYGEAAVVAGLVDGVSTYDKVMSKLSVDKQQGFSHNPQNIHTGNAMKTALTDQQLAVIAAGGALPAATTAPVTQPSGEAAAPIVTDPANPNMPAEAAAVEGQAAPAPGAAATPTAALPATTAIPAPDAGLVAFLQAQVKEKDAALLQAGIDLKSATTRVADLEASTSGLIAIAVKSTNNMRVALGGTALDMSSMSATQILADHDAMQKQFTSKFVAGGVAAVDAAHAKKDEKAVSFDALTRARLQAAQPKPVK